jgi:hypothetical protein
MEATERRNYPYYIKLGYMPLKGLFGYFIVTPWDRCPTIANLLSLDARLVIPTRVLHFEASGSHRRTLVRPVSSIGQTNNHRSDRSDPPVRLA